MPFGKEIGVNLPNASVGREAELGTNMFLMNIKTLKRITILMIIPKIIPNHFPTVRNSNLTLLKVSIS